MPRWPALWNAQPARSGHLSVHTDMHLLFLHGNRFTTAPHVPHSTTCHMATHGRLMKLIKDNQHQINQEREKHTLDYGPDHRLR